MSLTVTLPWPTTELWPNRNLGRDWKYRHPHKQAAKDTAYMLADVLERKAWGRVR